MTDAGLRADGPAPGKIDAELVERTLGGDNSAFDTLVERHQRRVISAAYRLLGNSHDAMEAGQEALIKAYRSLSDLKERERFAPWLMRITTNVSLNYRRSRRRTSGNVSLDEEALAGGETQPNSSRSPPEPSGPEALSAKETGAAIEAALADLPDRQRLALVLFSVEGWPQKDVAEMLECSVEAVKWHVFTARKKLREKLADYL